MQVHNGLSGAGQRCHTVHHEMNGSRTRSTITMIRKLSEEQKALADTIDLEIIIDVWDDLTDDERREVNRKLALIARDLGLE